MPQVTALIGVDVATQALSHCPIPDTRFTFVGETNRQTPRSPLVSSRIGRLRDWPSVCNIIGEPLCQHPQRIRSS